MWSHFPGTKNHCFVSIFKIMVAEVPHPFSSISIYPKMNSCSTVFRCSIVARSLPANRAIMRNEKPTQLPFPFTSIICFELNYRFSLLIFDAFSGIWCKWTEERTSKQIEHVSRASSEACGRRTQPLKCEYEHVRWVVFFRSQAHKNERGQIN